MSDVNQKELMVVARDDEIDTENDLLEMALRMLERWKLIVIGALLGAIIAGFYSFVLATPMYEATSKLYVLNSSDSAINLSDLQIGSYLTSDYIEVFNTWEVHEIVRQNLKLSYTNEELQNMMTLKNPSNTRILYITIKSSDPQEAATLANEYAEVAGRYISSTMEMDEPNVLSEAQVPEHPVSPKKKLYVAIGFIVGALLMCGIVVVQFMLDDKIKNEDDVKKYIGLPTLAVVPDNEEAEMEDRKKFGDGSSNTRRRQKS